MELHEKPDIYALLGMSYPVIYGIGFLHRHPVFHVAPRLSKVMVHKSSAVVVCPKVTDLALVVTLPCVQQAGGGGVGVGCPSRALLRPSRARLRPSRALLRPYPLVFRISRIFSNTVLERYS